MKVASRIALSFLVAAFSFVWAEDGRSDPYYAGHYVYGYGFAGGWGFYGAGPWYFGAATVPGDIYRGWGTYLAGLGRYRVDTAVAESIHLRNWIVWNEYLTQSRLAAAKRYAARLEVRHERRQTLAARRYAQLRDRPTDHDVRTGSALNLKYRILADPQYGASVFESLAVPVSEDLPAAIPFSLPREGLTASLNDLRLSRSWPSLLMRSEFDEVRTQIQGEFGAAFGVAFGSADKPRIGIGLMNTIMAARKQLDATYGSHPQMAWAEASQFLRRLEKIASVYDSGTFLGVMAELRSTQGLTLGGLLETMQVNRMQFGVADDVDEIRVNFGLYRTLAAAPALLPEDLFNRVYQRSLEGF